MINDYEIDKIYTDEFGKISGVFAYDKPEGILSHDVVYQFRRNLNTKKVGHAGALDPFASGLLIILAGKATKLSDSFLSLDKEYIADIVLGIKTDTLDTEGKIEDINLDVNTDENIVLEALKSFQPKYEQYVPIFSSVKVNGDKLRELARKTDRFEIIEANEESELKKKVIFYKNDLAYKTLNLPCKSVMIYEIELLESKIVDISKKEFNIEFSEQLNNLETNNLQCLKVRVKCSKGTYIRKLAEDIGEKLNIPSMLIGLRRTKVGEITVAP